MRGARGPPLAFKGYSPGMRHAPLLALCSALAACNPGPPSATSFGAGPTSPPGTEDSSTTRAAAGSSSDTSAGDASSGTSSSTSSTSGESTGSEPPPDFGTSGPEGCLGKIDFLFVISNSDTMTSHQDQVPTIFPAFLKALADEFQDFDSHIMVVETDEEWYLADCSLCGADCNPDATPPHCGAELTACDNTMGAGVTFPAGKDSSNKRCPLAEGRYITSEDPDPAAAFDCIARVGSGGGAASPADAMVAALSPPLLGTMGYPENSCNKGFLRGDALLVVTIISDGYDQESSGPAEAWRKALMDAKNQDASAFQTLVITTDRDTVNGLCGEYIPEINRLRTFIEITDGLIGSICEPDYGPFFDAAVAEVMERCKTYVPQ